MTQGIAHQPLAELQIDGEEAIAQMIFGQMNSNELSEEDCADLGRAILKHITQTLSPEQYSLLYRFMNGEIDEMPDRVNAKKALKLSERFTLSEIIQHLQELKTSFPEGIDPCVLLSNDESESGYHAVPSLPDYGFVRKTDLQRNDISSVYYQPEFEDPETASEYGLNQADFERVVLM